MTAQELAAIVARDAESIVWAPGTLASDPAVNDKLWQAVQDRRALLVLLRETREALRHAALLHRLRCSSAACREETDQALAALAEP